MTTQSDKAMTFRALHEREGAFVIPNPYDKGTARLLADAGFEALATTSAGFAFGLGRADYVGNVSRAEALEHARDIVSATPLPVSADLENGYGDTPEIVAETVRLAAGTGLVGCSIEDTTGERARPIYDFGLTVERIAAAAEAARALPVDFMLTARAENYVHGRPDLDDTIRRLQAFEKAGADVLYAPGLRALDDIRALCDALTRPVNVVMGRGVTLTLADLAGAGVSRVSVGSALSRAALGAFLKAAREIRDSGTFSFAGDAASFAELDGIFNKWPKE